MQFDREKIYAEMLFLGEKLGLSTITKYPTAAKKILDQTLEHLSAVLPTLQRLAEVKQITLLLLAQNNLLPSSESFLWGEGMNDNQRIIDKDIIEITATDFKIILEKKYVTSIEAINVVAVMATVLATDKFKVLSGPTLLAKDIAKPGSEIVLHPRYE